MYNYPENGEKKKERKEKKGKAVNVWTYEGEMTSTTEERKWKEWKQKLRKAVMSSHFSGSWLAVWLLLCRVCCIRAYGKSAFCFLGFWKVVVLCLRFCFDKLSCLQLPTEREREKESACQLPSMEISELWNWGGQGWRIKVVKF